MSSNILRNTIMQNIIPGPSKCLVQDSISFLKDMSCEVYKFTWKEPQDHRPFASINIANKFVKQI